MNDLKAELERLAGAPGPAPAVDVAAAVVAGRRARRMRRARRATAVAVAAGAVAAVAVVAVPPPDRERPDKIAEPPAHPSPLVEKAAFGWLPAGYARTRVAQDNGPGPAYKVHAGRGPGEIGRAHV